MLSFFNAYTNAARVTAVLLAGFFCLIYYPMKLESFVALMVVQTNPKPLWGPIKSWKVGATNGLDGTASTGNTGYTWSCTAWDNGDGGGSRSCSFLMFSSTSASQPTVTGAVFGDYTIHLCDGAGMNCVDAHVGAVDYDSNGVVQNSATVSAVFGPMIAFGQNPWGEADERELYAITGQNSYLTSLNVNPPAYTTKATGTITYKLWGNSHCTALNGAINSTDTTIVVTDASCLNLSTFPTLIMIDYDVVHDNPNVGELIWICSVSTNTLNACYDGRGAARGNWSYGGTTVQVAATSHSNSAVVGNYVVAGTSTLFSTDSVRPLCPVGVPGLPGPVVYSTGTVTLSAGSPTLTGGSGATFTSGMVGDNVTVTGATHGGTPFHFMAVITAFTDATHVTMSRNAPTGVDGSAFAYKFSGEQYFAPQATIPGTSSVTNAGIDIEACASETQLSAQGYNGYGAMFGTTMTGVQFSYLNQRGATGFSNYALYGGGFGFRALWNRSGLIAAKTLADNIDENWINQPEVAAGYGQGGAAGIRVMGVVGTLADKATNATTALSWDHIRNMGDTAAASLFTGLNCNVEDARTVGIGIRVIAELANYDTVQQSHWNDLLYNNAGSVYNWANLCKTANYSFSQGFNFSPTNILTMTFNSKNIVATSGTFDVSTGAGQNACYGVATGTATVTHGSDVIHRVTGTFPINPDPPPITYQISLVGTKSDSVYTVNPDYKNIDADNLYNAGIWDGDTGTIDWMAYYSGPSGLVTTFALDGNDHPAIDENFECMRTDATHAVLNRVWDVNDGNNSSRHMSSYVYSGYLQAVFLASGPLDQGLWAGSRNINSTIASAFTAFYNGLASWATNTTTGGLDPIALAPHYCRGPSGGDCEPVGIVPSANYNGRYTAGNSSAGTELSGVLGFRMEVGEMSQPFVNYFLTQGCSSAAKTFVDQYYGALWGNSSWNTGGVYQDAYSGGNNLASTDYTNASLSGTGSSPRWANFFFGMGMAYKWPAVRSLPVGCGSAVTGSSHGGNFRIGGNVTRQ